MRERMRACVRMFEKVCVCMCASVCTHVLVSLWFYLWASTLPPPLASALRSQPTTYFLRFVRACCQGARCQGASCHARCKHSSPAFPCIVGRLGQEEGSLSCWGDSYFLLNIPFSFHSNCYYQSHCKLPGSLFKMFPGPQESQGLSPLQTSVWLEPALPGSAPFPHLCDVFHKAQGYPNFDALLGPNLVSSFKICACGAQGPSKLPYER